MSADWNRGEAAPQVSLILSYREIVEVVRYRIAIGSADADAVGEQHAAREACISRLLDLPVRSRIQHLERSELLIRGARITGGAEALAHWDQPLPQVRAWLSALDEKTPSNG